MELREKVAAAILDAMDVTDGLDATAADRYADAILSIPEIAEALGRSYKGIVIVEDASLKPGEMKFVQPPNA